MTRGFLQVYTGEGKGKTTAALGLALRALGAGLRVYFGQFIKGGLYSEILALEALARALEGRLRLRQYGLGRFIRGLPSPEDLEASRLGLLEARAALLSEDWDLVILDELNVAVSLGLVREVELLDLVAARPGRVELLITGRSALPALIARADLVTEMRPLKHYYEAGVAARVGIES